LDPHRLHQLVVELTTLGGRRTGTPSGLRAAKQVALRLLATGVDRVWTEPFRFPRHDVLAAELEVEIAGRRLAPAPTIEAFEASGAGSIVGEVVSVATATDELVRAADVAGRVALVERLPSFHRSTQYANVCRHGARAMLDVSQAPGNLRQVGSIRRSWTAAGSIPAATLGAVDGALLSDALAAKAQVTARMTVRTRMVPAVGRNIVGCIRGASKDRGLVVIAAHYDSWFEGATDNAAGVAALIALAAARAERRRAKNSFVFAAFDGEEIALYGAYDFLRRHLVRGRRPIVAVLNLETPSAHGARIAGWACSDHAFLDAAMRTSRLDQVYPAFLPMNLVPELFGGVIPADVQPFYRAGIATMSTAVDAPYYHTTEDTPDKVDYDVLAEVCTALARSLDELADAPALAADAGPEIWRIERAKPSQPRRLAMVVRHGARPVAGAAIEATWFAGGFFPLAQIAAKTDERGWAQIAPPALPAQTKPTFLHVTAGLSYPLAETIWPSVGLEDV
jgi:hypothetical protein